ncbi:MAG: cytidine deaminase [Opitutaceae bacterium]|jgi:cytidine deaminase|nr:cytidine deaminase [Opitutaceae bacterium]|tara:strand:+ start:433 stop:846 length:414 start_codon:yes stop_codon:yes gene_type:complete
MPVTPSQLKKLKSEARAASRRAYAPYSKFKVGAAILTKSGKIYAGCNVENASYGLCNCAERTAIFSAVAAGEKKPDLQCVVVYTSTPKATAPCGACRQVIYEFGPKARVVFTCRSKDRQDHTITELLPKAFGPVDLV